MRSVDLDVLWRLRALAGKHIVVASHFGSFLILIVFIFLSFMSNRSERDSKLYDTVVDSHGGNFW